MTSSLYPPFRELDADWSAATLAVQAGRPDRAPGSGVNVGINTNATYLHDAPLEYARDGNTGWGALEAAIGSLEGGTSLSFATGLAAATAILDLVPAGGIVVMPTVAYYGARNIAERMQAQGRIHIRWVDMADTEAVIAAVTGANMVWMESIANPLLTVADVPAIAQAARAEAVLSVVDATFATPLRQQPLSHGADIVMHSATKFIGGHSDLTLGLASTADVDLAQRLWQYRHDHGNLPGNLECFLALRGLRTLGVRLERAEANAAELALRLDADPRISAVHYPGLPHNPNHQRAIRSLRGGFGAMVSFDIAGTVEQTDAFLASLTLVTHATSLGGVETLMERRARYAADATVVGATMIRASVGIENIEDLWHDIDSALQSALDA